MTVPNNVPDSRKAAVYRLYGGDGTLLYIGSSYDPDKRCEAHHRTPWWPDVARRTDEWFASRWKAYSAETAAIWKEQPRHNVAGTRGYARTGVSHPPKQRAGYMAYTWRRDACANLDLVPMYKAVLDSPAGVDPIYVCRAEQAAAELIEDMQGLAWEGRRRLVERGRLFIIRALRNEAANDADVATVMAIVDAQLRQLPYLHDTEPYGSRRLDDGTVVHVVHAGPASYKNYWRYDVPAFGFGGPLVETFEEVEEAARLLISKSTRQAYEQVAVRIRTIE